jgi:hypothetical protein
VDVPTGSGGLDPATDAASAAATGVVPRAECVHRPKKWPANTQSGRDRKTTHGKMEREKHPILPQAVQPCRSGPGRMRASAPEGRALRAETHL